MIEPSPETTALKLKAGDRVRVIAPRRPNDDLWQQVFEVAKLNTSAAFNIWLKPPAEDWAAIQSGQKYSRPTRTLYTNEVELVSRVSAFQLPSPELKFRPGDRVMEDSNSAHWLPEHRLDCLIRHGTFIDYRPMVGCGDHLYCLVHWDEEGEGYALESALTRSTLPDPHPSGPPIYEQPAILPGVESYQIPAYETDSPSPPPTVETRYIASRYSPSQSASPFAPGDLVQPKWKAGQHRRATVTRCYQKGRKHKTWWVEVAWINDAHKTGDVRADQLQRTELEKPTPEHDRLAEAIRAELEAAGIAILKPASDPDTLAQGLAEGWIVPKDAGNILCPLLSGFMPGDRVQFAGISGTIEVDSSGVWIQEEGAGRMLMNRGALKMLKKLNPEPKSKAKAKNKRRVASGWIETREGNKKRKKPSVSHYYCFEQKGQRTRKYIPAAKVATVQQLVSDRRPVAEILEVLEE